MSLPGRILDRLRTEPSTGSEKVLSRLGDAVLAQAGAAADRAMLGSQRLDLGEGIPAGSVAARVLAAPARWEFLSPRDERFLRAVRDLTVHRGHTLDMLAEGRDPRAAPDRLVAELAAQAGRQLRAALVMLLHAKATVLGKTPAQVARRLMRFASEQPRLLRDADLTWQVLDALLRA